MIQVEELKPAGKEDFMKKRMNKFTCIVLALAAVSLLFGCSLLPASDNGAEEYSGYLWNGGDRSKHLVKFAPELDTIPRDYLEYINLNPDEYEISTLEQWSDNNFGAQSAYNSFVYSKEEGPESGFYIWVEDDGRVIDTRFENELEPAIQKYFAERFGKDYPDVRIMASIGFHNMPSKEWSEADGIENLFNSNDDYRLYLYMVYGKEGVISETDVEAIKNELAGLNDVEVWFFELDNPDTVEKKELYSMKADFHFYEHQ